MSPDVHWSAGNNAEQETIAHTSTPHRSRRSWIVIAIVVVLGAGLGVAYRSLPEPLPRPALTILPTPQLTPTRPAIPTKLFAAIDDEAQALADGDFEAYRTTQTQAASAALEAQRRNFSAWGRPGNIHPLYTIVDFNLQTDSKAWADVRQFREGRYFRETRFYYRSLVDNQWLRGPGSDFSLWHLWSGQDASLQTPHFNVIYAVEDRDVLSPTMRQMEEDYQSLCRDLGCAPLGHELTFTVRMTNDESAYLHPVSSGNSEIWLPSPRVTGFYESGRAYYWQNNAVHWVLAQAIIERVYGTVSIDRPGGGILWASIFWAVEHIDPLPSEIWLELGDLTQKPLLSLAELWDIAQLAEPGLALVQLSQLMRFVEHEYGAPAVAQLLETIDSTKSFAEAIEAGLHVPFAEFDQKWQAWLNAGAQP